MIHLFTARAPFKCNINSMDSSVQTYFINIIKMCREIFSLFIQGKDLFISELYPKGSRFKLTIYGLPVYDVRIEPSQFRRLVT